MGGAVSSRYRKDQALWEVQGSEPQLGTSSLVFVSYIHNGQSRMLGLKSPPLWTPLILPGTRMIPSLYLLCCCCLVTKLCPTICNPMDYCTPGLPVPHHLPEFAKCVSIELVMWSNLYLPPKTVLLNLLKYIFIRLYQVLVAACRTQFPDQRANLDPLHWECRVLATRPPGKSPKTGS